MVTMRLEETIEKVNNIQNKTRSAVINIIIAMPGNKEITNISRNCFVVQSGVVTRESIWSAQYYNFGATVEHLCSYIRNCEISSIVPYLKEIIETGTTRVGGATYTTYVPPEVRQYLNEHMFHGELKMKKIGGRRAIKRKS
jgi:hypothetical protein